MLDSQFEQAYKLMTASSQSPRFGMATILNDSELRKLFDTVIVDGVEESIRPNSYILRVGAKGEYINTGKEFELGKATKGVRVPPGHAVGLTAMEVIDFRRKTVHDIYPGQDLHAFLSPTTDLAREGIVAPSTQIDAGYYGTLNWTLTNNSAEERRFVLGERIYRLSIWRLEEGETPEAVYDGDYQGRIGYVRSQRKGAPVGMRNDEWEVPHTKEGPEAALEDLIRAGYPWNLLGERLKRVDDQFKAVSYEYSAIQDAMDQMKIDMGRIEGTQRELTESIRNIVREELVREGNALQNRWLIGTAGVVVPLVVLAATAMTNQSALTFMGNYGIAVALGSVVLGAIALTWIGRK